MFAVVKSGGKQYRVSPEQELTVERVDGEIGETVELPASFVAGDDGEFDFGGGTVEAEILEHLRGEKIHVYKYRPKKRSRKKTGHRQELTRIKIKEV